jgi:simple sugar transport system permease protein
MRTTRADQAARNTGTTRLKRFAADRLRGLVHPLAALLLGLVAGAIAIVAVGGSVAETYAEMWKGAFGSFYYTTNTLARSTPIMLIGLGVALAFRSGFFNLGAEGQLLFGALAAAVTALYLPVPPALAMLAALVAGIAAGGAWSLLAGWLDLRFRLNLLISTLLLNYIAIYVCSYFVSFPLKDTSGNAALNQTNMVDRAVWLPKLFKGMSVHAGFVIAAVAAVLLYLILRHTVAGYHLRMHGSNPLFALYGGVRRGRLMAWAMLASGGFAGLAGAVEVLGTQYRYIDNALTAPGYAWSGIMAALLANSHPLGTAAAAILLAALQTGGMGVERNTEVPLEIASVIQAAIILFISARFTLALFRRRKARAADGSAA